MFILKILFAPLSLILSLFVWLCVGLLRVQAGKRTALPAGFRRADYLLRKERHHTLCAGVSDQPDGTSAAGCAGTWQAARREHRHEKFHP